MALVHGDELLTAAQKQGYAVGAFNAENMEMVQAIIAAAEEMNAPVIIQTTPGTLKYATTDVYLAMVKAMAESSSAKIAMHLDHGDSYELAMRALGSGYTSIMIDGSKKSFEENIEISKRVIEECHKVGIPVETELGKVGGKEDDLENGDDNPYTDPLQAKEFVERTGTDYLAIGVGTAHGVYKGEPKVNVPLVAEVREVVPVPLVLHGTSGVPDETVRACIRNGICKVNYATDLRIAFTKGVREYLDQDPKVYDPKKYCALGRTYVKEYVKQKMTVCGCADRS